MVLALEWFPILWDEELLPFLEWFSEAGISGR